VKAMGVGTILNSFISFNEYFENENDLKLNFFFFIIKKN
jgi:hypothetical protein